MSELVKVKIRGLVTTSQYGSLSEGDILNCPIEFARHLVEDCNAAEYLTANKTTGNSVKKPKNKLTILS